MKPQFRLTSFQARRIALAAQGFAQPRPQGRIDRRHLRKSVGQMGLIQIDSVNVLVRSQELPLLARLGNHPRDLIPKATAAGELFEYWVHEACHVPVALHPYLRYRMAAPHRWKGLRRFEQERSGFIAEILQRVHNEGPMIASALQQRTGPKSQWWSWDDGKRALEILFKRGLVSATRRANDFARIYDVAERVIPTEILNLPTPTEADQRKELLIQAVKHLGVGTLEDLTDYHRMRNPPCRPLVPELVEDGKILQGEVQGWDKPVFMHPETRRPRKVEAAALLSPFDPVVWNRDRTERLFDFRYRIEIYVPKPKRQFGYYVLPFLLGERLVARVDLKADRQNRKLLVLGVYAEDGVEVGEVAEALGAELVRLAEFLGLENGVVVRRVGNMASVLRQATALTG